MLVQSIVVVTLCAFLRVVGFRMEHYLLSEQERDSAASVSCLQFSIRDILVWTTATVPVLVVAKEVDWFLFRDIGWHAMILAMMLGVGCAAATLVGMWAGLGQGSIVVRLVVLGTAAPCHRGIACVDNDASESNTNLEMLGRACSPGSPRESATPGSGGLA